MLIMNSRMKKIQKGNECLCNNIIKKIDNIVYHTRVLNGCIVYDTENLANKDIDTNNLLRFTKTLTGYEIGCNELQIELKSPTSYRKTAIYLLEQLENKFPFCRFVVYFIAKDNVLEIRFHKYRKEDGFWLSDNLEVYEDPILCATSLNVFP